MKKLVKYNLFVLSIFLLIGCQKEVDIKKLNNYWEIKKVENPNGGVKEYTFNETIDFIEVEGDKGFRKKVKPQLDGTFLVTNDTETFKISKEDGVYTINYSTQYANWKEEIEKLTDETLVIRNQVGLIYTYQKYENNFREIMEGKGD